MADSLPSALTALTTADTDHAADLALVYDTSATTLKKQTVREIKNEQGLATTKSSVVHKPHTNYADPAATSVVVAGGGDVGASTRTLESGVSERNEIGAHASYVAGTASVATISGGYDNRNDQLAGTIAGGGHNLLSYTGDHGVIGGGSQNAIIGATSKAVIAGGTLNVIGATASANGGTIGGGNANTITQGATQTVAGGTGNNITSSGIANTVGGGSNNDISSTGAYGTICGGLNNTISAASNGNTILGGSGNTAAGGANVLAGQNNTSSSAASASMVVGASNDVTVPYSLIVGYNNASMTDCEGSLTFGADGNPFTGGAKGNSCAMSFTQFCTTVSNGTATTYNRGTTAPTLPINTTVAGRIMLIGHRDGGTSTCFYTCDFVLRRAGSGNIVVVHQAWTKVVSGMSPDVLVDPAFTTGSTIRLTVTGAEFIDVNWTARFDAVVTAP